ncbi:unnamed protein product [Ambrosiozyma monospora]|uniref:Unnamed protein product n=1 Tax=Ambrosiozyma monospora TaxID=43982 RepID=A0A9W6YNS1_AMBMO|nr:unnamed protein product [Ambrosiozyma monospora]
MDNSVLSLGITLVLAFILISWFMTPEPTSSSSRGNRRPRRRNSHPVTQQMIATVQQVAPTLTIDQIRYDLERTGDVNVTIDNYLRLGDLPNPPHSMAPLTGTGTSVGVTSGASTRAGGVSSGSRSGVKSSVTGGVGLSKIVTESEGGPFGGLSFEEKRRELVMAARARISAKEGITWN